jgi:heme/copper-type cytochrome/quinol oxidase subunit 1
MITKIKEKPFLLLIIPIVLFWFFYIIPSDNASIDIQTHDVYFVIAQRDMYLAMSLFFLFFLVLYFILNRFFYSKKLIWLHVVLTTIPLFLIFYLQTAFNDIKPRNYYSFNELESINEIMMVSFLVIFFSQFLFLINIIVGVLKKSHQSK